MTGVQTCALPIWITVEQSPLFFVVGALLLVGVAAGLWWVFQKYGRR